MDQGWAFRGKKPGWAEETGCQQGARGYEEKVWGCECTGGPGVAPGGAELVLWAVVSPVSLQQGQQSLLATFRKSEFAAACSGSGV